MLLVQVDAVRRPRKNLAPFVSALSAAAFELPSNAFPLPPRALLEAVALFGLERHDACALVGSERAAEVCDGGLFFFGFSPDESESLLSFLHRVVRVEIALQGFDELLEGNLTITVKVEFRYDSSNLPIAQAETQTVHAGAEFLGGDPPVPVDIQR